MSEHDFIAKRLRMYEVLKDMSVDDLQDFVSSAKRFADAKRQIERLKKGDNNE